MATIKIDPQTTKNIIKDITTTQFSSYQLGHKYKLSKITIDRIGREHLGKDIYSRREKLAFANLRKQILELRSRDHTMSSIAENLGISKSSIFVICKNIDRGAEHNSTVSDEVQVISIESKENRTSELPAKITSAPVTRKEPSLKSDFSASDSRSHCYPQKNQRYSFRTKGEYYRRKQGYIKIQFNDIQITFSPSQPEAEKVVTRILSSINSKEF